MGAYVLSDYSLILVIWGVLWMVFGGSILYLVHRTMSEEEKSVEQAESAMSAVPIGEARETSTSLGRAA